MNTALSTPSLLAPKVVLIKDLTNNEGKAINMLAEDLKIIQPLPFAVRIFLKQYKINCFGQLLNCMSLCLFAKDNSIQIYPCDLVSGQLKSQEPVATIAW